MSDTLTGKTIGKYEITEKLGRGGMAEVYKGYQENLDRYVAIKLMHAFLVTEEDFLQRFKREARAMAALRHPNIVRVYDFDVYGEDSYYLVMEYINGGTLKEGLESLARANEKLPLERAVKMVTEVADALAYAHKRGMVHRDIKPANIMIDQDTGKAILTDFGIVKLIGNQSMTYTATGALIGTPAYMSPEQALGKAGDERVDIYSLGVLLFQMVAGQLPFDADTPLAVVMKHVNDPTPLPMTFNPDVPIALQEVILKAMAKDPDNRYQTADEMAMALRVVDLSAPQGMLAPPGDLTPDTTKVKDPITGSVAATVAEQMTQTAGSETAVAEPVTEKKKRPVWLYPVIGIVGISIVAAILYATGVFTPEPTPTTPAVVVEEEATATNSPTPSSEPGESTTAPNNEATALAQIVLDLTRAAEPTETPTPTNTPTATPTNTPTPDLTAEFLSTCTQAVELVSATRGTSTSNSVTTGVNFTATWVLLNSGTCPWPDDLQWVYFEGSEFGYEGEPIPLDGEVLPGEEVTLTAGFVAPGTQGTFDSTWQLVDGEGNVIGEPVTFEFRTFLPSTPTPVPTNTPTATPAVQVSGHVDWIYTVGTCDYPGGGSDWRCPVTIIPYIDGSDEVGQFTVFVFDLPGGQATQYRGTGPFTHFVQARRCAPYNQEVRIVDDVTATELSEPLYVDPNNYFPGGCTES